MYPRIEFIIALIFDFATEILVKTNIAFIKINAIVCNLYSVEQLNHLFIVYSTKKYIYLVFALFALKNVKLTNRNYWKGYEGYEISFWVFSTLLTLIKLYRINGFIAITHTL